MDGSESTSNAPASLLERMKQRTDDIAQRAEQRRQEKENQTASSESAEYFQHTFQEMRTKLQAKVERAGSVEKSKLVSFLDGMVKDVQEMQQLLNESSMFLASFQIKTAQEELREVDALVHSKIDELQPKKKFGFGKKRVEKTNKAKDEKADAVDHSSIMEKKDSILDNLVEKQFFGFKDEKNKTLTKSPQELESRQLNLYNLHLCRVVALGNPGALQFASLHHCTVIVGPTSRSAFIKDCTDCKFIIACQQVRIHNTLNTQFYLHVTSAAIIENCQDVQVAPYNLDYPELTTHFQKSGLNPDTNYWEKIEDFHWLNESEKSPNWSVIPETERFKNWLE